MNADVLILGTGPAGLQAAIHAARKKVKVIALGKISGSALAGTEIENYFGFPEPVNGTHLLESGISQATSFGCEILRQNAVSCSGSDGKFTVVLESGEEIKAKVVVIATGISRKKLGIPGEKEYLGKGVSYCASCDCNFFKGVPVMIIGSESAAAVSAEMMTGYASKVYWSAGSADVAPELMKRVKASGVEVLNTSAVSVNGAEKVSSVKMSDGSSIDVKGVFVELGGKGSADLAMDLGVMPEMDDTIKVKDDCSTTVPGVYACGDVAGKPWQLAKAVGQGAVAGAAAAEHAKGLK